MSLTKTKKVNTINQCCPCDNYSGLCRTTQIETLDIVSLPNLGHIVTRTVSVNKDSLVETTHCSKYFELSIH